MSEELHSGIHPDADALNALIEGVLPEHERLRCLTHLAECAHCREVLYVAQQAAAVEEPVAVATPAVPFWRRLFRPMTLVPVVAVAAMLVFSVGIYRMIRSAEPRPQVVAKISANLESPPPPAPQSPKEGARFVTRKMSPPPANRERVPQPAAAVSAPPPQPQPSFGAVDAIQAVPAAPPPQPTSAPPVEAPDQRTPAPLAAQSPLVAAFRSSTPLDGTGITGTVTDPAGSVIPRARIEVKNEATGATYTSISNPSGQFNIAGLAPGRYDLRVDSTGFISYAKSSIDVQPQTMAKVNSTLQVGSVAEAVTVTAESPLLKAQNGAGASVRTRPLDSLSLSAENNRPAQAKNVWLLPGKRTAVTSAARDKIVVAADAEGSLFFSDNEGKNWKRVKGNWKGKVVRVISPPNVPGSNNQVFELITDPASTWLSADGRHWSAAPAPR